MNLKEIFEKHKDSNQIIVENSTILTDNYTTKFRNISNKELIIFSNCQFNGIGLYFEKIVHSKLKIHFKECVFNCSVFFDDCILYGLKFVDTKKIKSFEITNCKRIGEFYFKNTDYTNSHQLQGDISITNNTFYEKILFQNLNHYSGEFNFTDNKLRIKKSDFYEKINARFDNSIFQNSNFSKNDFGEEISFTGIVFNSEKPYIKISYDGSNFGNVNFERVVFFGGTSFNDTIFSSDFKLTDCQNLHLGNCSFTNCISERNFIIEDSEFDNLNFSNFIFKETASFIDLRLKKITIIQTVFEKPAFFENIIILNVKECSRKTLRLIKHQLQRTDNKIDYNKFKAYELNAYSRELHLFHWKDKFILWLNSKSSNHGLDWFLGIKFTLIVGLIFYSMYFASENFSKSIDINSESINAFFIGYFKFLVPTYSSPLENGLNKWYLYFPFLIGKIFITYGIYQTIVSFRKFKF